MNLGMFKIKMNSSPKNAYKTPTNVTIKLTEINSISQNVYTVNYV